MQNDCRQKCVGGEDHPILFGVVIIPVPSKYLYKHLQKRFSQLSLVYVYISLLCQHPHNSYIQWWLFLDMSGPQCNNILCDIFSIKFHTSVHSHSSVHCLPHFLTVLAAMISLTIIAQCIFYMYMYVHEYTQMGTITIGTTDTAQIICLTCFVLGCLLSFVPRPFHVFQHTLKNWENLVDWLM